MNEKTVYIVDDEDMTLDLIKALLDSVGLKSKTFSSALEFIDFHEPSLEGCLVLDINMPDMSGLELQEKMNSIGCTLPIIFITGYGNIVTAVEAMKAGAQDFFEKPYDGDSLVESIRVALEKNDTKQGLLLTLTPRENEIVRMLADSMSNKEIARDLDISPRTVEVHRQHIMKKLKVRSVGDLQQIIGQ